jgi:signal transduction histidine kinase
MVNVDRRDVKLEPQARLAPIVDKCRQLHGTAILLETEGGSGTVAMGSEAFDTVVTHLLNNAIEATGRVSPVRVVLRFTSQQMQLDIIDCGPGMSAEFVRDELFRPFRTLKRDGSGLGAFQARELLRDAGGDLIVISCQGEGTTMRLLLPIINEGISVSSAA